MSLKPMPVGPIPAQTIRVAQAAFPKGNAFMAMRDELGVLCQDEKFVDLFSKEGRGAIAPWRLTLVTLMQFAEGLTDRQAADAVRSRLDWKYALSLELEDSGFDFSVLSEFRSRLLKGEADSLIFDTILEALKERGLLKAGGRMRSDSTHIVGAVRALNRVMLVGETLRAALNALAVVVGEWLKRVSPREWHERYDHRIEEYHLPKEKTKRIALAETYAADGYTLLKAIDASPQMAWLNQISAVQILRRVWLQQFEFRAESESLVFRAQDNIPAPALMISSPYDTEVTLGRKRTTWWTGYKVHLSEKCEEDQPNLITHVETSRAGNGDVDVTPLIHAALKEKQLVPQTHLVDTGYGEAKGFVAAQKDYGIDLLSPTHSDNKWQAQQQQGFDVSHFHIDWQAQQATCPAGKLSSSWSKAQDRYDTKVIKIKFSRKDCKVCEHLSFCTKAKTLRRTITIRHQEDYLALQAARKRHSEPQFWQQYKLRAGIEGTLSQGVRSFDLRQARYRGLAKTHLQHLLTASAMNVMRALAWLQQRPKAKTPRSHFAALAA